MALTKAEKPAEENRFGNQQGFAALLGHISKHFIA
jgi:hypothetical protein